MNMDRQQKAEQLLEEKVRKCEFSDEFYTLVNDLVDECISEVEEEVDGLCDDDGEGDETMWYDFVHEDMVLILCERIKEWLA